MKKIIFSFGLLCLNFFAVANDLTFFVVNESGGASNGSVNLTVTGGVAPFIYSWVGPAGYTANTEDITGLKTGTYTVTVTDKYCGLATIVVFVDASSDVKEINDGLSLLVYPNPSNGQLNLTTGKDLNKATLKLINIAGVTVMKKNNLNGNNFIFDISEQTNGIYFLEITNVDVFSRIRFIKN